MMVADSTYIRAISMHGIDDYLAKFSINADDLLSEVGIDPKALRDFDSLVSFRSFVTLFELISKRTGVETFGLDISQSYAPDYVALGPITLIARFSRDLEEWLALGTRYFSYHSNAYTFQLIDQPEKDTAILRVYMEGLLFPARHAMDCALANLVGVTRTISGEEQENPTLIKFNHRAPIFPESLQKYKDFFRCPVEFGAEFSEIHFARKYLKYPLKASLRVFKPLMSLYVGERIRRLEMFNHSTSATVALVIPTLMGSGNCTLESVAEALGRNVKMLQRELQKENITFSDILENTREAMARRLLSETKAPIQRIAGLLDYTGAPPFNAAFTRWTGRSPSAFRKAAQKMAD